MEPLSRTENQDVRLTLEEYPTKLRGQSNEATNQRIAEWRWLAENSEAYAGEWIALDRATLLAHGLKLAHFRAIAIALGVQEPFFARVPKQGPVPFAGW